MSTLDRRIAKLEERAGQTAGSQSGPIFFHLIGIRPGDSGPEEAEPVGYKYRVDSDQVIYSLPGEGLDAFVERIKPLVSSRKRMHIITNIVEPEDEHGAK